MSSCRYPPAHSVGDYRNCGCTEPKGQNDMSIFFTCTNILGGTCGHKHRSIELAAECAKSPKSRRDQLRHLKTNASENILSLQQYWTYLINR